MKLISFAQVMMKRGGRSRSSTYRDIEAGLLPKPIKIGGRLYWDETEVDEKIAEAMAEREAA